MPIGQPSLVDGQQLSIANPPLLNANSIEELKNLTPLEKLCVDSLLRITPNTETISRKDIVMVEGVPHVK